MVNIRLTSRVIALFKGLPSELVERQRSNIPYNFPFLSQNPDKNFVLLRRDGFDYKEEIVNASPVGEPREVTHLTLHDMKYHAVCCAMTEAKFLEEGFDANAVFVLCDKFERLEEYVGKTTYQPMKIIDHTLN